MKRMANTFVTLVAALMFSTHAFADIDPDAASASHHFEGAAATLHHHLHVNYTSGYGSHGLEGAGSALHSVLHDWHHGEATESEVDAAMTALRDEWNAFRQTIIPARILKSGDATLDEMYEAAKSSYKKVQFLLRKAEKK